ncbi:MAG TPA: dihydropteroate synthase [Kofleriaceae bacterium]|nr:dihydropteroate synthase [Kofleriaceae bacterium]
MSTDVRPQLLVMGVVNVTPDSFSDGGKFLATDAAIAHGLQLLREGADILDVGGEATNPRAQPVDAEEECRRVVPVIAHLAGMGARVSVDTTKAAVALAAVRAGAAIVNDVSGGLFDPDMPSAIAGLAGVTYIAGHLRGRTIAEVFAQENRPHSTSHSFSWREVAAELGERLAALPAEARQRTWVDPGIGFGKGADPENNLSLLRHAGELGRAVGCPVVVGASRKRFLKTLVGGDADLITLDVASVAACLAAVRGGAQVLRIHNVALLRAALAVYTKV